MNIEELEHKKLSAELSKLLAEEEKVREEIRHLKTPALLNSKVITAVLVALIGLAATGGKLYITTLEKNDAVAQEKATEAYANNLKQENQQLTKGTENTESILTQFTKATIKFRGSISREQASGLQLLLNESRFVSPRPFRTSSIETTEVIYFHEADFVAAKKIKDYSEDYFNKLGCPIGSPINIGKESGQKSRRGEVVLNVYHKCG